MHDQVAIVVTQGLGYTHWAYGTCMLVRRHELDSLRAELFAGIILDFLLTSHIAILMVKEPGCVKAHGSNDGDELVNSTVDDDDVVAATNVGGRSREDNRGGKRGKNGC